MNARLSTPRGGARSDAQAMQVALYGQSGDSSDPAVDVSGGAGNSSPAVIFGNGSRISAASGDRVEMEWDDQGGNHHFVQNNMMRVDVDVDNHAYSQSQQQQNIQQTVQVDGRSYTVIDQSGAAALNAQHAADLRDAAAAVSAAVGEAAAVGAAATEAVSSARQEAAAASTAARASTQVAQERIAHVQREADLKLQAERERAAA